MSYFEHNAERAGLPSKLQPITNRRESHSEYAANAQLAKMVRK